MAGRWSTRIERDTLSEPPIRGRRVCVRQVYALVEERGEDPEAVDRFDLDVADVCGALAYHHDRLRETREIEAEREAAVEPFRRSIDWPEGVALDAA